MCVIIAPVGLYLLESLIDKDRGPTRVSTVIIDLGNEKAVSRDVHDQKASLQLQLEQLQKGSLEFHLHDFFGTMKEIDLEPEKPSDPCVKVEVTSPPKIIAVEGNKIVEKLLVDFTQCKKDLFLQVYVKARWPRR